MNKPRNDLWKVQKHFSDGKVTVTPARRQSTTGTNNFTEDAPASRTQLLTISLTEAPYNPSHRETRNEKRET